MKFVSKCAFPKWVARAASSLFQFVLVTAHLLRRSHFVISPQLSFFLLLSVWLPSFAWCSRETLWLHWIFCIFWVKYPACAIISFAFRIQPIPWLIFSSRFALVLSRYRIDRGDITVLNKLSYLHDHAVTQPWEKLTIARTSLTTQMFFTTTLFCIRQNKESVYGSWIDRVIWPKRNNISLREGEREESQTLNFLSFLL